MPAFDHDGVTIDFLDEGTGAPVVLIHGFASNRVVNWVNTGWVDDLVRAGHRVIALDNRGHGYSSRLYEPHAYRPAVMASDVIALVDHLHLEQAALVGYSMGARIAAFAAHGAPGRVSGLVLGGMASNLVDGVGGEEAIASALLAPSAADVSDETARAFRVFAEQTGSDLRALAACIRAGRERMGAEAVAGITAPALVVAGEKDEIAGSAERLAALLPHGRAVTLPGRDHMTAVGDRQHKSEVRAFLAELAGVAGAARASR
jgi:pimeloyl-ACP methyl ester carboxylesterase